MTALTKTQVSQLRADITAALASVTAKHGVDFSIGTIRFDADKMSGKLTGMVRGAAGTSPTVVATPKTVGLAAIGKHLLGSGFKDNDKYHSLSLGTVKIVGYNNKAHTYPFIVQTTGGKRYKITTLSAQNLVKAGAV